MAILTYDIGGSSIKYGVVSEQGELAQQGKVKTPATREEFYAAVAQIRKECPVEVRGAGFSFPGAVDYAATARCHIFTPSTSCASCQRGWLFP